MIPMDSYERVNLSWYPNETVVRIGCIRDGSCFFHSVIGSYYIPYQNNNSIRYRKDLIQKLRRDLAYTLELEDPTNPGKINWETAADGQFMALYEQQKMGVDFKNVFGVPIDFSLEGLQKLFNSNQFLGDEVYQYASDMIGVDIYIMRLTDKDLYVHQDASKEGVKRKVVVISGNGDHYEIIGVERNGLFQTVFEPDDPFIVAIGRLKSRGLN